MNQISTSTGADSANPESRIPNPAPAQRGTLYIVAAPSGAGKSSIVNAVLARDADIALSISFTSRGARPGERHAQHYHFITADEFKAMIRAGDFFEYAEVHGDWKGTARQSVEPQLAAGKDVLLEIDWQGARQVREKVPEAVSVFILPPSRDALEQRMRARGQDSEEVIQRRLAAAREEMSHYAEFDYVIVNDVFEAAVEQMHAIFTASRLRREAQDMRHAGLIAALLAE
ncbi:guanylate kinase [Pseudoxanthomonas sp. Root65]|uniref:guanylate kinase n=1 Tax=Pseudoxanthomonas sp. Root65 TaxID=1736576 RepID=UPI0009EAD6FF|nr:guanylate kinase [Pseudoxanthomonas sp. Root65]